LEDNQISIDKSQFTEIVGNEIQGSAAAGMFLYGSTESYIEGNYIHHTWADHIHHTNGAKASWVWNNYIFNEPPSKGDDGVACVTYGAAGVRCNDMEWWHNNIVHTGNGRGYAVIGGNNISIHDNWAVGVAGAGVIIASEEEYSTAASQGITVARNYVQGCGHTIGHPGILVSGAAASAGPLRDIAFTSNVSVGTPNGPYRVEGSTQNVTNTNLRTDQSALPAGAPTATTIQIADTSTLRTRDTSFVEPEVRKGLYRIHIRKARIANTFEQRFEYIVKGPPEIVTTYVNVRLAAADHLVEQRTVEGTAYALLLTAAPISVPSTMSAITFRELRAGDQESQLSWLWKRLDATAY
jgi:parallel beta-helix repeat protein